jgi:hypothetical protein
MLTNEQQPSPIMTPMPSPSTVSGKHDVRRAVAEIADAPADVDLVDDIVQRAHEQGNDAGDGEFAHQLSDALGAEKAVCFCLHDDDYLQNIKKECARPFGLTHFCHATDCIIPCAAQKCKGDFEQNDTA